MSIKKIIILSMLFIICFSNLLMAGEVTSERVKRYAETPRGKKYDGSFYFNGRKLPGRAEEWVWIRNGEERRPFQKAKSTEEARKKAARDGSIGTSYSDFLKQAPDQTQQPTQSSNPDYQRYLQAIGAQ